MDCWPLGKVLTCSRVLVSEEGDVLVDEEPDGEIVVAPPPIVEMTVRPAAFVVVINWPDVIDGDKEGPGEESALVGLGDWFDGGLVVGLCAGVVED